MSLRQSTPQPLLKALVKKMFGTRWHYPQHVHHCGRERWPEPVQGGWGNVIPEIILHMNPASPSLLSQHQLIYKYPHWDFFPGAFGFSPLLQMPVFVVPWWTWNRWGCTSDPVWLDSNPSAQTVFPKCCQCGEKQHVSWSTEAFAFSFWHWENAFGLFCPSASPEGAGHWWKQSKTYLIRGQGAVSSLPISISKDALRDTDPKLAEALARDF